MVDVPFSRPFYQWLLREDATLSTRDLLSIDPTIANTVSQLEGIVRKKRRLEEDDKGNCLIENELVFITLTTQFISDILTTDHCIFEEKLEV